MVKVHYGNIESLDSYKIGKIKGIKIGENYTYNKTTLNTYFIMNIDNNNEWEIKISSVSNKDLNERECF